MTTEAGRARSAPERAAGPTDGAALAALLAAGIGAFAMGLFVILNETGVYAAPTLYGPAGGVSGRTTFAVVVWLAAWLLLHRAWNARNVAAAPVYALTAVMTVLGLLLTFPPFWGIF
jgi:hypothetical protein